MTLDDILVHDAHEKDTMVHVMLASMKYPDFPVALGIIRDVAEPTYEREVARQIAEVQATAKIKNVDDLLNSGETCVDARPVTASVPRGYGRFPASGRRRRRWRGRRWRRFPCLSAC